uniref:BHLH domain-containing protein n=1 Tax=Anopheles farauti TaxID=69004 RepID=A0A182QZ70_9DIPT
MSNMSHQCRSASVTTVPVSYRLGPCELPLPEQWLVNTQLSQSAQPSQASFYSASQTGGQSLGGLGGLSASTLPIQQQHSSSAHQSPSQLQNQIVNAPQSAAATAAQSGAGGGAAASAATASQLQSQSKIMNVVVPSVACPPTASKKIRRKPDTKQPQSQINKCNNEKRRRELENEYIEQLGEFLQIKRDMTACKPDKAAILSEVVRTFRHMLEQGNPNLTGSRCSKCSPDCSASCKLHPVQQGEVSSTEPPLPEPSVNGHSPEKSAYFEAVQHYISNVGWALLEINSEGVIECATENVRDVLHYSRTELHGQSIYSYLHTGDHSKLSPILNKNSFELNWDQNEMFYQTPKRTIRTKIRWLLRAPEGANETIEQKQQRLEKYKDLLIISAPVKDDTEESSSVLCLITLPEDDQAAIETTTMPQTQDEQLTLKLDTSGNIINYDSSTLRKQFAGNLTKENIRSIYDICHYQDRQQLIEHLGNVRSANGTPLELNYRLRLGGPDVYVHVKTQSKLFRCTKPNESDFIMAVCTVLTENEVAMLSGDGGGGGGGRMVMGGGSGSGGLSAALSGSNINNNNNGSGSSNSSSNPTSSSSLGLLMPSTSSSVTGGGLNGGNDVVARHMAQITQGVSNMGGPLMSSVLNGGGSGTAGPTQGMLGGPSGGGGGMTGGTLGGPGGGSMVLGPGGAGLGMATGGGGTGMGGGPAGGASMGSIVSPRSNPNSSSLLCGPSSDSSNFFNTDFELEFPHSTFDMESVGVGWDSRPDSRTSVTPVSTPRPPSVSAYSPAAAPMCASPMTPYYSGSTMGGMPSPSNNNNNNNGAGGGGGGNNGGNLINPNMSLNNNNNNTNNNNTGTPFGANAFQFPFDDSKDKLQDIQSQPQQQQHHHPHMSPMQQHQSTMQSQLMVQRQQHQQQHHPHQQHQQHLQQQQQQQQPLPPANTHDSERLRNLLTTKRPHSNASSSSGLDMDHDHRNPPNRILKVRGIDSHRRCYNAGSYNITSIKNNVSSWCWMAVGLSNN